MLKWKVESIRSSSARVLLYVYNNKLGVPSCCWLYFKKMLLIRLLSGYSSYDSIVVQDSNLTVPF